VLLRYKFTIYVLTAFPLETISKHQEY